MRPYQLLPAPDPTKYDPGEENPNYFYDRVLSHFIPDMIDMMCTGLIIDDLAVQRLEKSIDTVQEKIKKIFNRNKYVKQFLCNQFEENKTKKIQKLVFRKPEDFTADIKNIAVRTFVFNYYLKEQGKEHLQKDKWKLSDLKQLAQKDVFAEYLYSKSQKQNALLDQYLHAYKKYKADLWNKNRYATVSSIELGEFNPNSNKQKTAVFSLMGIEPLEFSEKTDEPSWPREVLELLVKQEEDPVKKEFIQALIDNSYSAIIKNNFLKSFESFVIDGRLHGNIKLFGAKSCRNTSNNPNLLNAPSSRSVYAKPFKECITAPEGYIVYAVDLDALEDKVIANASGDANKIAILEEGIDGHSFASIFYHRKEVEELLEKKITDEKEAACRFYELTETNEKAKKLRTESKPGTFALAYGAYPPKIAKTLKCSIEKAQQLFDAYHNQLYPGITAYREEYVLPTAQKQGYLHLGLGCRIYTDNPKKDIRTLVNATIQFWSILTLIAINEINYRKRQENYEEDIKVCSTIYDSIYFYVKKDPFVVKWLNDNIIEILSTDYIKNQRIHNSATGEIGNNWAHLHKIPNNASIQQIQEILNEL